jgi:exosome complex protein LRP1
MLERQQYEKELKEQDEAETEEELAVFGEDDTDMNVDSVVNKEKGKGKEVPSQTIPPPNNRRTRPAIDPFAGYGDDLPGAPDALPEQPESKTLLPRSSTSAPPETKTKRSKKRARDTTVDSPSATPRPGNLTSLPISNEANSNGSSPAPRTIDAKKPKKAKKKTRK